MSQVTGIESKWENYREENASRILKHVCEIVARRGELPIRFTRARELAARKRRPTRRPRHFRQAVHN